MLRTQLRTGWFKHNNKRLPRVQRSLAPQFSWVNPPTTRSRQKIKVSNKPMLFGLTREQTWSLGCRRSVTIMHMMLTARFKWSGVRRTKHFAPTLLMIAAELRWTRCGHVAPPHPHCVNEMLSPVCGGCVEAPRCRRQWSPSGVAPSTSVRTAGPNRTFASGSQGADRLKGRVL